MTKTPNNKMMPSSAVEYFKALLEQSKLDDTNQTSSSSADHQDPLDIPADNIWTDNNINNPFLSTGILNLTSIHNDDHVFNSNSSLGIDLTMSMDDLKGLQEFVGNFKHTLDKINPISDAQFWTLSIVYSVFIIFGFFGNVLILWAVLGRESMRTARNVFIVTLAISDLVLCLFTMPSKLWEVR